MIALFSAALAACVVAVALMTVLFDCRTAPPRGQRIGLSMMAAGLLWAAPARMMGGSPGLGDLVFLLGLLVLLLALYGRQLGRRVDAIDGHIDGRLGVVPLHRGAPIVESPRPQGAALSTRRGPRG